MTERKNFCGQATPSIVDTEYRGCNFAQPAPVDDAGVKKGVRLFPGDDTPRTFIGCNGTNCEWPPGSTVIDCFAPVIAIDILLSTDEVEIDGVVIPVERRGTRLYGKLLPTGEYTYLPEPRETEIEVA